MAWGGRLVQDRYESLRFQSHTKHMFLRRRTLSVVHPVVTREEVQGEGQNEQGCLTYHLVGLATG